MKIEPVCFWDVSDHQFRNLFIQFAQLHKQNDTINIWKILLIIILITYPIWSVFPARIGMFESNSFNRHGSSVPAAFIESSGPVARVEVLITIRHLRVKIWIIGDYDNVAIEGFWYFVCVPILTFVSHIIQKVLHLLIETSNCSN